MIEVRPPVGYDAQVPLASQQLILIQQHSLLLENIFYFKYFNKLSLWIYTINFTFVNNLNLH